MQTSTKNTLCRLQIALHLGRAYQKCLQPMMMLSQRNRGHVTLSIWRHTVIHRRIKTDPIVARNKVREQLAQELDFHLGS